MDDSNFLDAFTATIAQFTNQMLEQFGLPIVLFSTLLLILSLVISFSPMGRLRLGGGDAVPEFGLFSWLAMLFTCGMGSGLIFWGVAEPIFHFANLPPFAADNGGKATDTALALTYFHWGLHAWAIYGLAGLAIAWFAFNRGRALSISASFTDNPNSLWRLVDWLAVLAIIFGVAGTFANGIALIQTGVQATISPEVKSVAFRYITILMIAILATISSLLGLHRGIKWLSQFNTLLMLALVVIVTILVSPLDVFKNLLTSTGSYLSILPEVSFTIHEESRKWSLGWTVIYIVWWVAWAPFVSPFIARISRGRTVRQFLLCVVLVPTVASMVWFSAFGGVALTESFSSTVIQAVQENYTKGLFSFYDNLPLGGVLAVASVILLITFIITSADSALLVCSQLAGNESNKGKLLWAVVLVILSLALIHKNDVDLNKQVAIAGAFPFMLIIIAQAVVMCFDMWRVKR